MNPDRSGMSLRIFTTISGLKEASSIEELDRIVTPLLSDLGFPCFAAGKFFSPSQKPDHGLFFGKLDTEWVERYSSQGYAQKSRIAREMLVTSSPYSWSDVIKRRGLDDVQARICAEARAFGYTDGLYSPFRYSDGSYGAVVLCGAGADMEDAFVRNAAEVIAAYYSMEGRRLVGARKRRRALLSSRQRECLLWVRHGKSSADISEILGLAVPTVDGHIAEACRKLGVRTRVQAVVEASLAGLLDN